jgi:hypothetical protein
MKFIFFILLVSQLQSCAIHKDAIECKGVQIYFIKEIEDNGRWINGKYVNQPKYLYEDDSHNPYLMPRYEGLSTTIYGFVAYKL